MIEGISVLYNKFTKYKQTLFNFNALVIDIVYMTSSSTIAGEKKDETTGLANSTYNILIALGKEAKFLYSTVDTYTSDAQKANRSDLVNMWNTIKQDRQKHLQLLREALEKEARQEKLI
jgi:rubrerythrin